MCLGVPVKIIQKNKKEGIAEFKGIKRKISLELLDKVKVGDYVVLHAGFAIQKLDRKEALKTLKLFDELEAIGNE
ncbi:MAG: HypC/HybG/HupF family hydrogenase formation chaperone [candidate division Zixibacteria bacterium]|jgi:hydrogenase expression/formation protein HypC|nr:HypC/HybG/HupF family hydrogenase formation chaperone [candidate division Zixibacteria bacterium]